MQWPTANASQSAPGRASVDCDTQFGSRLLTSQYFGHLWNLLIESNKNGNFGMAFSIPGEQAFSPEIKMGKRVPAFGRYLLGGQWAGPPWKRDRSPWKGSYNCRGHASFELTTNQFSDRRKRTENNRSNNTGTVFLNSFPIDGHAWGITYR